jgi:hypothetical protein
LIVDNTLTITQPLFIVTDKATLLITEKIGGIGKESYYYDAFNEKYKELYYVLLYKILCGDIHSTYLE